MTVVVCSMLLIDEELKLAFVFVEMGSSQVLLILNNSSKISNILLVVVVDSTCAFETVKKKIIKPNN